MKRRHHVSEQRLAWQPAEVSFELPLLILIGPMPVPLQCSVDNLSAEATKRSRMHGVNRLILFLDLLETM
jgi:hypothetical protein